MLMEGTKNRTPRELEEALDDLGVTIKVTANRDAMVWEVKALAYTLDETFALLKEMLTEPRWDGTEFARLKKEVMEAIAQRSTIPSAIASDAFYRILFGKESSYGLPILGTRESVADIQLSDLKTFYEKYVSPQLSALAIAGDINRKSALKLVSQLNKVWMGGLVTLPSMPKLVQPQQSELYFVDIPGAKQSEIRAGNVALSRLDPEFYSAVVMNHKLGGNFSGRINRILREEKGYTYGARSIFNGLKEPGPFMMYAAVRTDATYDSVQIMREEITKYAQGISDEELQFTRDSLIKANALAFETVDQLIDVLYNVANFELPLDYLRSEEEIVANMDIERHKRLAKKYLNPSKMITVVVGDRATQAEKLKSLAIGKAIFVDVNGNIVP
jgi:zinc protease